MSTEHVVVQFDAQTQAVVRAVEGIEARLQQLGHAHARQSRSMQAALDRITTAGQRVAYHYGLIHRSIVGLLSPFAQITRKALDWEQSMTKIGSAIGGVIDNAIEATGVTGGLAGAIDGLVTAIGDAESPIGSFVRDGLGGIVTAAGSVVGVLLEISSTMYGVMEDTQGAIREISAEYEERGLSSFFVSPIGDPLQNARQRLSELETQAQSVLSERSAAIGPNFARESPEYNQALIDIRNQQAEVDRLQAVENDLTRQAQEAEARIAQHRADIAAAQSDLAGFIADFTYGLGGDSAPSGTGGGRGGGRGGPDRTEMTWLASALVEVQTAIRGVTEEVASPGFTGAIERVGAWLGGGGGKGGAYDKGGQQGVSGLYDTMLSDQKVAVQSSMDAILEQGFGGLPGAAASALGDVSTGIADFVRGTEGAFASMGEALKSTLAGALGSIGSALTQGAVAAAISGSMALGPIGLIVGLGMALLTASGLLGGTGGGATANAQQMAQQADVFSAIRTDQSGNGGSIVYHTSIGAYFGDAERSDAAARGVAGGLRRLRRTGEMPR